MENNKKPWPLTTVCGIRERIDTNPDFQRPAVWSKSQKQLLIDTVLRNYDVPKMYWRKLSSKPDQYDVVDGQQRLRAIWEFRAGDYRIAKDADSINGDAIAGLSYEELPDELRMSFDIYPLDVVVITDTDEDEVREMFLRLQNGTTLKAQEKRNAMPGKMRDFVKELAKHKFFTICGFANRRYTFDHVAAQMTLLELTSSICNVKNADLNKMYKLQKDFDSKSDRARKIKRLLDYLYDTFEEKTPELERYNAISLYALISYLSEKYVIKDRKGEIKDWFLDFEKYRKEEIKKPEDEADPEIIAYHGRISHSTDSIDSLKWRHELLSRHLFESIPDIVFKDNNRSFTYEQRLAIFRRDKGLCQLKLKCVGSNKCEWNNWHADHITPWSKGGQTTVANGQVACQECNLSKGDS
jgi:hypothetical protein